MVPHYYIAGKSLDERKKQFEEIKRKNRKLSDSEKNERKNKLKKRLNKINCTFSSVS